MYSMETRLFSQVIEIEEIELGAKKPNQAGKFE